MVELSRKNVNDSWKVEFRDRLRRIYGENVAEFSRLSGINDRTLRKYIKEKAPAMPGVDILARIYQFSGKSASWLLTGKEEAVRSQTSEFEELKKKYDDLLQKYTEKMELLLKYQIEREPYTRERRCVATKPPGYGTD